MKIGTDAVLLGAWCKVPASGYFLDIGCGSGIISLMLAQRGKQPVTAVEIDADAYLEAVENVCESPWKNRINVVLGDIRKLSLSKRFSLIVCNPPFYTGSNSPDDKRNIARHDSSLSPAVLFAVLDSLLDSEGLFYMIYPGNRQFEIWEEASKNNLFCNALLSVKPRENLAPVRLIFCFSRQPTSMIQSELILETHQRNDFTEEYKKLTADFYLKF